MIKKVDKQQFNKDLHLFFHSLFLTPGWIDSVSTKSSIPVYFDILDNNSKIGKISGLLEESRFGKQLYFYSSPALIKLNDLNVNKCLDDLKEYAVQNNISRIIVGSYDNKHSLKYSGKNYYITQRAEYIVPLYQVDTINQNNNFKRNVKKAKKLQCLHQNTRNKNKISTLLILLNNTLKARIKKYNTHYSPYYLKNLSEKTLYKLLENKIAQIHFTFHKDKIDCIEFNLESNGNAYMLLKGTNEFGYKNGFSSFLSNELINKYVQAGYKSYNQGGRPLGIDGDGLTTFKKSMGAEEIISHGATTNFIIWPYKILNPILIIGRLMPQNNFLIRILKRFLY